MAVDTQNKAGRTALMFAAKYGQLDLLTFLLDAGASVSVRMKDDSSAFDWAVLGGHRCERARRCSGWPCAGVLVGDVRTWKML